MQRVDPGYFISLHSMEDFLRLELDRQPMPLQSKGDSIRLDELTSFHTPVSICGTSRLPRIGYVLMVRTGLQADDIFVASHLTAEMLVLRRVQPWKPGTENFSVVGVAYGVIQQAHGRYNLAFRGAPPTRAEFVCMHDNDLQELFGVPAWWNDLIHPVYVDLIHPLDVAKIHSEECEYRCTRNEDLLQRHHADCSLTFSGEEQDFILV